MKKRNMLTVDRSSPFGKVTQYGNSFMDWEMKKNLPAVIIVDQNLTPNVPFQSNSLYKQ